MHALMDVVKIVQMASMIANQNLADAHDRTRRWIGNVQGKCFTLVIETCYGARGFTCGSVFEIDYSVAYDFPSPLTKIFTTRPAVRVKIRLLAQTHSSLTSPRALTLVVERRSVVHASVVPDGQIILVLPSLADMQIVVLNNQLDEPFQCMLAFLLGQAVDLLHVMANSKDRFPACDGIRSDHGMLRSQFATHVLRSTARLVVQVESVFLCGEIETRLRVCGREAFEEFLVRR
jgi:hypothetical protein